MIMFIENATLNNPIYKVDLHGLYVKKWHILVKCNDYLSRKV